MFLQTLVTGLSIGGIYALMAVGYSLIFSVLSFSNFAHGAVIMLGAYIGLALAMQLHLGLGLVVAGSVVGAGILSVCNERIAYAALRRRKAPSPTLRGLFGAAQPSICACTPVRPSSFTARGRRDINACSSATRRAFIPDRN